MKKYINEKLIECYAQRVKDAAKTEIKTSIIKQMNCPNCGAPITSMKCEYCGTDFEKGILI